MLETVFFVYGFQEEWLQCHRIDQERSIRYDKKKQEQAKKRLSDLDVIISRLYEDYVLGNLSQDRYKKMAADYEAEQERLKLEIEVIEEWVEQREETNDGLDAFIALTQKYVDVEELTQTIVNEYAIKSEFGIEGDIIPMSCIPLAKLLPMTLEEMCEELRKRPGRGGKCIKETTVQKYLETVSSVLEDAKKNDIIPFNPAHRVRKKHFEKEVQHIPHKYEMGKLMRAIQNEPILYRAYYTLAITTGLRRGELCALQWRDITGACELTVCRSRSCASGQIVESDTKSHRERIVTIPLGIWELLMALRQQQVLYSGVPDRKQPIFTDPDGHVPHPDSFTRHLRKLYKKCGLPEEYHLHTLRHFYATYLLQEGTSKQVAASLLGHADTAFLARTYCHPQDVAKQQAANLMQDLLNNQNLCYVAFMKNKNRKAKKAG